MSRIKVPIDGESIKLRGGILLLLFTGQSLYLISEDIDSPFAASIFLRFSVRSSLRFTLLVAVKYQTTMKLISR